MQPIPQPHILDPGRIVDNDRGAFTADHEQRAELLEKALKETCAYGQQLWEQLDQVRRYLLDSLPPDPRTPTEHPRDGASPTGPDDDEGWTRWGQVFASVTSVLSSPKGDSGYGLTEARHISGVRRSARQLAVSPEPGA